MRRALIPVYIAMGLFIVLSFFPFGWILLSSFKSASQLFQINPAWWPHPFTWENYGAVFFERRFYLNIINSVVVAGATSLTCVALGSLAAYGLARLRFRGKAFILGFILVVSLFPPVAIVSPLFLIFEKARLINTYVALILPYLTFALPLTVWLLTAFFRQIPFELEEAARIDGAAPWRVFWEVTLPLAAPGIFTTAILTFIYCWNEFLFALAFTTNDSSRTIPVAIVMFSGYHT
ncbi:MAG TPA: carbohydrate ABC transporter permease, partial [Desulfobaccales bacterium]|nr:carbohydrate ABC transporter permease [Desulfobaccales bacterium]